MSKKKKQPAMQAGSVQMHMNNMLALNNEVSRAAQHVVEAMRLLNVATMQLNGVLTVLHHLHGRSDGSGQI